MKTAVCVFVIGESYVHEFNEIFKPSLTRYCKKNNYQLEVFTELIEPLEPFNRKKFFWQRLLIPSLPKFKEFDYVLTLDADILVSEDAPPLPELLPGKVGCVNERKFLGNYEWRELIQMNHGYERTGKDYHALSGFDRDYNDHIQGGFVLYQPKFHAELMKNLYRDNLDDFARYHQDDQSFLSIQFIDNNMVQWIDERFDMVWFFWKELFVSNYSALSSKTKRNMLERFIKLNYFCHFPGHEHKDRRNLLRILNPQHMSERLPDPLYSLVKKIKNKFQKSGAEV